MILDPVDRARRAHELDVTRLRNLEAALPELTRSLPADASFDQRVSHKEAVAAYVMRLEAAREAAEHSEAALARAQAAAEEKRGDQRHAAAQKLADKQAKLVVEADAQARKLAAVYAEISKMQSQIDAANAARGSRPFIVDGERAVREIPARDVPAQTRKEKAWIDSAGNRPTFLRDNGTGQLVPADHRHYEYREVEVVQAPARFEPARMPTRLAAAAVLPDLRGGSLWPPR